MCFVPCFGEGCASRLHSGFCDCAALLHTHEPRAFFSGHIFIFLFLLLENVELQPPSVTLQPPLVPLQPPLVAFHVLPNWLGQLG